jgi:hypothetical protein
LNPSKKHGNQFENVPKTRDNTIIGTFQTGFWNTIIVSVWFLTHTYTIIVPLGFIIFKQLLLHLVHI